MGTILDSTRSEQDRSEELQRALLRLMAISDGSWERKLGELVRADAEALGVTRASYWSIGAEGRMIRCETLWRCDTAVHESGTELGADSFPRYFAALNTGEPIFADDAHTHPATSEFSEVYLRPLGIGAMMDVPVYLNGVLMGVVCHEHVGGPRAWPFEERHFAMSIGQLIALAIEARELRAAKSALSESEARFRSIAEVSPVPLLIEAKHDGTCRWGNGAMGALAEVEPSQLVGRSDAGGYAEPSERAAALAELSRSGRVDGVEVRLRRGNGDMFWAKVSMRPMTFDGEDAVIVGITDVSELKRVEDKLRYAALHDALTGLPNRTMLFELLGREVARARREPTHRFAVLFIDLNGFKLINDTLGHDVGDQVLCEVGARLRSAMRPTDAAARLGGDEFAVMLGEVPDEATAASVAERIEATLAVPHRLGSEERLVPGAIGIAIGGVGTDLDELMRRADQAMYERKKAIKGAGAGRR